MKIEIYPIDTLFFKDGKPFSMGDDVWADGIFPPNPSVFYGALRTKWFSYNMDKFYLANSSDDPTKKLIIRNIFLKRRDNLIFPLPRDCAVYKKAGEKATITRLMMEKIKYPSNFPFSFSLTTDIDEKVEYSSDYWISDFVFNKYLTNNQLSYQPVKLSDYILKESKIGIARHCRTHATRESMMYRVGMNRLIELSFVVDFDGIQIPENGFLKLGGEGKAASYREYKPNGTMFNVSIQDKRFLLYLATPAFFEKGWLPKWIDEKSFTGELNGITLKLLTASVHRYMPVGGFSMKSSPDSEKGPKPLRYAVPPGSVYYFEIIKGNEDDIINMFHGKTISEFESDKEGFGLTFVGNLSNNFK